MELPPALATSIVTSTPFLAFKTALVAPVELFCVPVVAVKPIISVALRVVPVLIMTTSSSVPLAPPRSLTVSEPPSIVMISFPAPPVIISSPAPPEIVSIPPPPSIVSIALPPSIVSAPAPPFRVSSPVPPTSLKALEFPVAAETSIVTSTPSLAFKTALSAPAVLFCCVVLFAVKPFTFVALTVALELTISTSSSEPAPPRSVIISAPEVILKVSLPVPPVRLSVPAPPSRTSFPPLPSIISAPPDPVIMSPLSFPLRSKLPEPAFVIVIVLPSA